MKEWQLCPGATLVEMMQDHKYSDANLAVLTGFDLDYIKKVVDGVADMTKEFAKSLEMIGLANEDFWLRLQEIER